EPAAAAVTGANGHRRSHRMAERKNWRRTIGQYHLLHHRFEVGDVVGKVSDVAFVAIGQAAIGKALPAPIEHRDGTATRTEMAHGLEIVRDEFRAPLHNDNRALAAGRRGPARKA